jgi:ADP-heptose:LPS heptosyltransferase
VDVRLLADGATSGDTPLVAIRPGALGDALLTLPLLAWVRGHAPGARIALVTRRDVHSLALRSGVADAVSSYDDPVWSTLFADEPPARPGRAGELCAGARVAAWTGEDDGVVRRNLLALGASAAIVAPGKPGPAANRHMALQLADALAPLGYSAPVSLEEILSIAPALHPSVESRTEVMGWLRDRDIHRRRLVAIHPGSGGDAKRWPTVSFANVIERLAERKYTPILIEGPQDAVVAKDTLSACHLLQPVVPVARNLPIEVLAALLARCVAFLGSDSGVSHLAALAGCPTVAIFGPTNPELWRPIGRRVRALRAVSGETCDVTPDVALGSLCALIGEEY